MAKRNQFDTSNPLPGRGARVAVYLRDSGASEQELSIAQQRPRLAKFASEHDWTITAEFGESQSGKDTEHRPEFNRLIAEAEQIPRPFDVVLVWSLSRFGRDFNERMYYIYGLALRGIQVASVTQPLPEDETLAGLYHVFLAAADQKHLRDLSIEVRRAHEDMVAAGYIHGGTVAVGYRVVHEVVSHTRSGKPRSWPRLELDPEKAPLVVQAFEMRAQRYSYGAIHAACHLTRTIRGLRLLFNNVVYLGILKHGEDQITGAVPAIITQDLWDAVHAIESRPQRESSGYLLSGILHCNCGAAMWGHRANFTQGQRHYNYYHYICSTQCGMPNVPCDRVDREVLADIADGIEAHLEQLVAAARARLDQADASGERERIQRDLARCTAAIRQLSEAVDDPDFDQQILRDRLRQRRSEQQRLQAESVSWRGESVLQEITPDEVRAYADQVRAGVRSEDLAERRRMLARYVEAVIWDGQQAGIIWRPGLTVS